MNLNDINNNDKVTNGNAYKEGLNNNNNEIINKIDEENEEELGESAGQ
jgi:hypothetical protein